VKDLSFAIDFAIGVLARMSKIAHYAHRVIELYVYCIAIWIDKDKRRVGVHGSNPLGSA
jgi:hypothetical protein